MHAALLTPLAFFGLWLGGTILLRLFRMVVIVMRYSLGDLGTGKRALVFEVQYIGLWRCARGGLVHGYSYCNRKVC